MTEDMMERNALNRPIAVDVIPAAHVASLIEQTDQEFARLEREAAAAVDAALEAEADAHEAGIDPKQSQWTIVRLQRFLDTLREEANRDARATVEVAQQRARMRVEDAKARRSGGPARGDEGLSSMPVPDVRPSPAVPPSPSISLDDTGRNDPLRALPELDPRVRPPAEPPGSGTPAAASGAATIIARPPVPNGSGTATQPRPVVAPVADVQAPPAPPAARPVPPVAEPVSAPASPAPAPVTPLAPAPERVAARPAEPTSAVPPVAAQPVAPQPVAPQPAVAQPAPRPATPTAEPARGAAPRKTGLLHRLPIAAILEVIAVLLVLVFILMRLS
jgi:hypothetical protein